MTLRELIELGQAAEAGKTVQAWTIMGTWIDIDASKFIYWVQQKSMMRIKPEPRRAWVNFYKNAPWKNAYDTVEGAVFHAGPDCLESAVEFIEVLK